MSFTEQEQYPSGEGLDALIRKRYIKGSIWRTLFLLSTILAIFVLTVLLFNIINQTFGLTAVQSDIPEDVLVQRVHDIVPKKVWSKRYDQINDFEKSLYDNGTHILKFYLHISSEEQRERFQERVDIPEKNWKFSFEDLEKRKQWDDYMAAFEEMLEKTSTAYAPWYVIPANQNWYRNLAIERVIVSTLREMDPQFPIQTEDLSGIVVE